MPTASQGRPASSEYTPAIDHYIQLVPPGEIPTILIQQQQELIRCVGGLSDPQALVRHAPYTWSIKQVLGHVTDCERFFGYRAMRLARNDATPLAGFDDAAYVAVADFDRYPLADLLAEFESLRRSHVIMLRNLDADAWLRNGTVNDHAITMRAVACVMVGHAQHHLNILQKRLAG